MTIPHPLDVLAMALLLMERFHGKASGPFSVVVRTVHLHRSLLLHIGLWPLVGMFLLGAGLAR